MWTPGSRHIQSPPLYDPAYRCSDAEYDPASTVPRPRTELSFTPLAHEGYPGHLYQTVYSSLCLRHADAANRKLFSYGGYGGRAGRTIPERISYEYAAQVLCGSGRQLGQLLSRCAASLAALGTAARFANQPVLLTDLSLHYYGAEESELLRPRILRSFARAVGTCLRLSAHCPCGLFEVLRWLSRNECPQKKSRTSVERQLFPLRFHRFVLEAGPSDFENLTNG